MDKTLRELLPDMDRYQRKRLGQHLHQINCPTSGTKWEQVHKRVQVRVTTYPPEAFEEIIRIAANIEEGER